MGIGLLFAGLEVLHRLLNSRRAWLTVFHSHPTSPRGPVECLQVGEGYALPEVTSLRTTYKKSAMNV